MIRCYTELARLTDFNERFAYLKLGGLVGADTFGFDRYLNQKFYSSPEWASVRDYVIFRDGGCDLGVEGYELHGRIIIHHMNPILPDDIVKRNGDILDPEFLVTVSHVTHNAIHYGDESLLIQVPPERRPNDTCPWKK